MPIHSISRAHLHEEIAKLEKQGERVVTIVPDGATVLVVTETPLRYVTGELETR